MKAPERREREIVRTREDILEAAARAFSKTGLGATTMQDIAREAGYTAASLYTYFRSKDKIVEALLGQLTSEFLQTFEVPLPTGLTFLQRFDMVLLRQFELIERRRTLFLSFHSGRQDTEFCPGDPHGQMFHMSFERRIQRMAKWFEDNARPEDIGGHDTDTVARLLFGMAFGLLHRWMSDPHHKAHLADLAPLLRDFFFHGVSGRPKTGAKKR
jgi:AcrR family transcriptional regulator